MRPLNIDPICSMLNAEDCVEFLRCLANEIEKKKAGTLTNDDLDRFVESWYATAEVMTDHFKLAMEKYKNDAMPFKRNGKTWEDQCRSLGVKFE